MSEGPFSDKDVKSRVIWANYFALSRDMPHETAIGYVQKTNNVSADEIEEVIRRGRINQKRIAQRRGKQKVQYL